MEKLLLTFPFQESHILSGLKSTQIQTIQQKKFTTISQILNMNRLFPRLIVIYVHMYNFVITQIFFIMQLNQFCQVIKKLQLCVDKLFYLQLATQNVSFNRQRLLGLRWNGGPHLDNRSNANVCGSSAIGTMGQRAAMLRPAIVNRNINVFVQLIFYGKS